MVSLDGDPRAHEFRCVLQPQRSMGWSESKRVYACVAGATLTVAIGFSAMGLTLVLPFAGLELLALWFAFYLAQRDGAVREVVAVDALEVRVERGRHAPAERHVFPRAWARVRLSEPTSTWYPRRLAVGSHGRWVEVGAFLSEGERHVAARVLERALRAGNGPSAHTQRTDIEPQEEST